MKKYLISSFLFLIVASTPAWSQDLNALKARASRLWAERLQANKVKAADFIEKESRSEFPMFENVREATVTGMEFTADKSRVLVATKAKVFVPTVGSVDQTYTESWVWKANNWFVDVDLGLSNPFKTPGIISATTVRSGFAFKLVDKKIDLGNHKQGEKINGTVKFAASRSELQSIRARGMDGIRIGAIRWTDDNNGEVDFTIDSSLMSQDIDANVIIEGVSPEKLLEANAVAENLALVGRIEGKFRISQLPQTPEAEKGRFVELEIKNVGNAAFGVERIRSLDSIFVVAESVMPPLAPGQTAKVAVSYPGQMRLVDGELIIQLSEGVVPSNSVLFRIQGPTLQTTQQQPKTLTRAEFDAAVRKAQQDAERQRALQ